MGKTSCAVKNRYNAKTYHRITITIPKGFKQPFKEFCEEHGTNTNEYLLKRIYSDLGIEEEDE